MKRLFLVVLALCLLTLSSCKTTATTNKPDHYLYGMNEEIKIFDVDSNRELGTLQITDAIVLMDEPFTIKEQKEYDDNGDPVYENVAYEQLVQIIYSITTADSTKTFSDLNFSVTDGKDQPAQIDPEMEYACVETTEPTFVAALKNKSDTLTIDFRFYWTQGTTAKIKVDLDKTLEAQASSSSAASASGATKPADVTNHAATTENSENFAMSRYIGYNQLLVVCVVLAAAVIALAVVLGVTLKKRR